MNTNNAAQKLRLDKIARKLIAHENAMNRYNIFNALLTQGEIDDYKFEVKKLQGYLNIDEGNIDICGVLINLNCLLSNSDKAKLSKFVRSQEDSFFRKKVTYFFLATVVISMATIAMFTIIIHYIVDKLQ